MVSEFSPTESLLQALETLSEDLRLARVFGHDSVSACSLHLWLLELTQAKTIEYRLLFGWVIPTTFQNPDKWNISDGGKKKSLGTQKKSDEFRIAKLTLYHDSRVIFNLIKGLCKGISLDDSCDETGIVRPVHKNPYGQLHLAGSPQQLTKSFAVRPVVFLETSETNRANIEELKPITSPLDNVSAFAGSLWRLNKLSLFSKNGKEPLPQADNLAKKCLSHLTEETGLDFCGTGSKRLGNIEWICFPAADENENSQVKIITKPFTYEVAIEILAGALPSGTQVLIGCQLRNGNEIILDQCEIAQITEASTRVNFEAKEKITKILITIWICKKDEEKWEIWYKHAPSVIRRISADIGVVGLKANLPSDWLQEFINSRVREQIEKAQIISQVSYQGLEIGEYKFDPWVPASWEVFRLTQQLLPEPSGGYFFPKGWRAEELGKLSFFKWLQSLTNDSTASKILIVDPYFDRAGIIELIARAGSTQTKYVVLTNSQVKSDDDSLELESDSTSDNRETRLKKACKEVELLLDNLNFRLLALRKKEAKNKQQIFHDRYILVFDEIDQVKTGYHLSNSIQHATENYPLLATPIPRDVLTGVEDYVASLLAPADDEPFTVDILFSAANKTKTKYQYGVAAIPHAGLFFAALLNENILSDIDESELSNYLQNNRILIEEGRQFTITDRINSQLDHFIQVLVASSAKNFAKLWSAFGAWLARIPDSDEYLDTIVIAGRDSLAGKIQKFLLDLPEHELPIDSFGIKQNSDSARITDLLLQNFKEGLHQAEHLIRDADCNSWHNFSHNWGIHYGAKALAHLYPEELFTVVSNILQTLIEEINTNNNSLKPWAINSPNYWAFADTLTLIIKQILNQLIRIRFTGATDNGLLSALLSSNVPLLRSIGAQSLSPLWNRQTELQNIFVAIDRLQPIERVHALAQWVFELRVKANVKNYQEDTELRQIRLAIFDKIRQAWLNNLSQEELRDEELRDIVRRLSGPIEGSWALSTTNELLLPLVQENRLTINEIAQLWLTILFDRLKSHVSTTERKQEGETSHSYFFAPADEELTYVCGWTLANATVECRELWFKKLKKEIQNPSKKWVLYRPFSRSHDFSAWRGACDSLLWLQILFKITHLYKADETISNPDETELEKVIEKLDNILVKTEENLLKSTRELRDFLSHVNSRTLLPL